MRWWRRPPTCSSPTPDVVALSCPDRPDSRHGSPLYSTWWTLQTEQAVLDTVEAGRTAGVAAVPSHRVLADAGLAEDQEHAVRRVCGGERVAVLVGPAGSGKSRTLSAARQAWEQAGIPVRGVAPSAVAAGVLTEQAGIGSDTLAKFLLDVSNRRTTLNPGEVIVCDEASMVSSRDLARLVLLADAAGAKLVLVGDHYQLGSVDAAACSASSPPTPEPPNSPVSAASPTRGKPKPPNGSATATPR